MCLAHCIVTRAQARKFRDTVDLSDSFLCADNSVNAKERCWYS